MKNLTLISNIRLFLFQFSTDLRNHLDEEGLQLIEEFPFNTDENVELVVEELRVSEPKVCVLIN